MILIDCTWKLKVAAVARRFALNDVRKIGSFTLAILGVIAAICTIYAAILGGSDGLSQLLVGAICTLVVIFAVLDHLYCARYYNLKNQENKSDALGRIFHDQAETIRTITTKILDEGTEEERTGEQALKVYEDYLFYTCKGVYNSLRKLGYAVDRVSIKACWGKRIYTLMVFREDSGEPDKFSDWCGTEAENNPFWKIFKKAHTYYEECVVVPSIKKWACNQNLKRRPKFLAIGHLEASSHPAALDSLIQEACNAAKDKGQSEAELNGASVWNELKAKVGHRYRSCVAIMIAGTPPRTPDDKPSSEGTKKMGGFIGIDSMNSGAFDFLQQTDVEGVAAFADVSFIPLSRLKPIYLSAAAEQQKETL